MALLTDEEKAELRASLVEPGEEILSETCSILRPTESPDGYGQVSVTWAAVGEAACMIGKAQRTLPPTDSPAGAGIDTGQLWRISFLDTADVRAKDRLEIGSRVFEVVSDTGLGTYSIINRVTVKQII